MGGVKRLLALDIGERRIGVAMGDTIGRIAQPLTTLMVDGTEVVLLQRLILEHDITGLVIGLPRNQAGEETQQSAWVRAYTQQQLEAFRVPIMFQDESVTSVLAEQHLARGKKKFTKAAIDAHAAAIILQDYLEQHA